MKWIKPKLVNSIQLHSVCSSFFHSVSGKEHICKIDKTFFWLSKLSYSSHYDVLGVSSNASNKAIKNAYYAKCKKLHPDVNAEKKDQENEFMKIQAAYEVLKSLESRQQYDVYLKSLTSSHHDFNEWKAYNAQSRNEKNYRSYNTMPKASKGVDAKWSDFTFLEVFTMLSVSTFIIYIFVVEYIKSKQRKTSLWNSHKGDIYIQSQSQYFPSTVAGNSAANMNAFKENVSTLHKTQNQSENDKNTSNLVEKKAKSKKPKNKNKTSKESAQLDSVKPRILDVYSNANNSAFSQDTIFKINVSPPKSDNFTTWRKLE